MVKSYVIPEFTSKITGDTAEVVRNVSPSSSQPPVSITMNSNGESDVQDAVDGNGAGTSGHILGLAIPNKKLVEVIEVFSSTMH